MHRVTVVPLLCLILFQEKVLVRTVGETIDGMNTLGLIVVLLVIGMALGRAEHRGTVFVQIVRILNSMAKLVVKMIMQ